MGRGRPHEHVDTLASISSLAQLLLKRDKPDEAAPLALEGLRLSARLLGSSHAHTVLMHTLVCHVDEASSARDASLLLLASWPPPGDAWAMSELHTAR